MRAEPVGDAQAGAEIVRILHAIEHQQQRRLGKGVEDVVQMRAAALSPQTRRHDALVAGVAGQPIETFARHGHGPQARPAGRLDQVAHARVVARSPARRAPRR